MAENKMRPTIAKILTKYIVRRLADNTAVPKSSYIVLKEQLTKIYF